MIYKYDDIVKTTEARYIFQYVGAKDIGKAITIEKLDGDTYGGYITKITDSEITYMPMADIHKFFVKIPTVIPTVFSAKFIYHSNVTKICIYDPDTGLRDVYDADMFVKRSKKRREFDTDILKPGARFFAENPHGASICEVAYCEPNIVRFEECSALEGMRIFELGNVYDIKDLKSFTFKTIDELKPYDLCRSCFSGYKLSINAICKIKNILDKEKLSE